MTAYTAIPDSDIDPESPITSSLLTSIRDNPIAITEKSAGAPVLADDYVVQAMIAAGAVGQGELKTTTAVHSVAATTRTIFASAAGEYGFLPRSKFSAAASRNIESSTPFGGISIPLTTSYQTFIVVYNNGTGFLDTQIRYVQASPPYDLGDGEIPLFIFALIDNTTKEITSLALAPEAPWHYNGPTNIKANKYIDGIGYQQVNALQKAISEGGNIKTLLRTNRNSVKSILDDASKYYIPITQEIKNADMDLIPHPFLSNNLSGKTVVMLDPVSELTHDLSLLHEAGEDVSGILHDGHLKIDNTHSGRKGPQGLVIPKFRWKNSV